MASPVTVILNMQQLPSPNMCLPTQVGSLWALTIFTFVILRHMLVSQVNKRVRRTLQRRDMTIEMTPSSEVTAAPKHNAKKSYHWRRQLEHPSTM